MTTQRKIPANWQECPIEYLEAAMASDPAEHSNRWLDASGGYNFPDKSREWEVLKLRITLKEDTVGETSEAIAVQETIIEFARNSAGQVISRIRTQAPWWLVKSGYEGQDICQYCGTNNTGVDGESLRLGWDCYMCGGN